ncbi:MAG: cytochrome c3 family protein [Pyrinomonadaceae bacterium]
MKLYPVTFLRLALAALVVFSYPQQTRTGGVVSGQRRPARRVASPQPPRRSVDYSKFSHATAKHQGACNTCHKVPTENWKKARDFPDVADYPGHDACVSCHRPQFFKGAKPVICSVCHTKVSPRDDVRFAFRNPVSPRQFLIEFPHDKHQDVIARIFRQFPTAERALFVRASFNHASLSADDKTKHYNNCEICHLPQTANPPVLATGWPDAFAPDAATFKAVPSSHASCFNCHWKSQAPTNENCAGCHKLAAKPSLAVSVPTRLSLKFRHAREQHVQECTSCHINITRAATLRGLKPDVPITSCTECHNKDGLRQDVSKELEAIERNRDFVCSYCHTSDVGRLDPPSSHYLIAGREPKKRPGRSPSVREGSQARPRWVGEYLGPNINTPLRKDGK